MKSLQSYITEKLKIQKKETKKKPVLAPQSLSELKQIVRARYKENTKHLDCTDIDVSGIENFDGLFAFDNELETIDLTGWDTSNVTNMNSMFWNCTKLKEVIGIENLDVSNVTTFGSLFDSCFSLKEIDISLWNTPNCLNCGYMFDSCTNLVAVNGLDELKLPKCKHLAYMFADCENLKSVEMSNVGTNTCATSCMFRNCKNLETVKLSNIKFTKCNDMFAYCEKLNKLTLDNIDTSSVTTTERMFSSCTNLNTIDGNIEDWDVSKVMAATGMFENCKNLKLDLSKWKFDYHAIDTKRMFNNAPEIKKPKKR